MAGRIAGKRETIVVATPAGTLIAGGTGMN